ncbi:unnamed protein product [Caenorhabditis sp. 36 PRJEB53466]|nr:unnamed protein product [Caenorhabditis sp. 36 PRJEB53466]
MFRRHFEFNHGCHNNYNNQSSRVSAEICTMEQILSAFADSNCESLEEATCLCASPATTTHETSSTSLSSTSLTESTVRTTSTMSTEITSEGTSTFQNYSLSSSSEASNITLFDDGEVVICDLDCVFEDLGLSTTPTSETTDWESLMPDTTPIFNTSTIIDDTTTTTLMYSGDWDYNDTTTTTTTTTTTMLTTEIEADQQTFNFVDIEQTITHPTDSTIFATTTSSETSTSVSSSTSTRSASTTAAATAGNIVDIENIITHPTASTSKPTTTTSAQETTTTTTAKGLEIVDVSAVITHPTVATSSSTSTSTATATSSSTSTTSEIETSTAPWTEVAKAADSVTSTTTDTSSSSTESSTYTSSSSTATTVTTTIDPACAIQCPDGYVAGNSLCFLFANLTDIKSYQSALSYCQTVDSRNLISLEHLRNLNDLTVLKAQSESTNWYFANGGGSVTERFDKEAQVFDLTKMTALTSPIANTVGLSDSTSNVSAICVLPQYCNVSQCFVDASLTVLGLTSTLTENSSAKLTNTTGELVTSCSSCFSRGTASCEEVTSGNTTGYMCVCKSGYTMATCFYTGDECTSSTCNGNGECTDVLGELQCACEWGYSGDTCEVNKDRTNTTDSLLTRIGNSFTALHFSAFQSSMWSVLTVVVKSVMKLYLSNGQDDPQETHQALRSIFMTFGSTCVLFFHDPYLFKLHLATCRTFFVLIHFCFLGAMIQWMLEGYNANQVVRCVHMNEWERDFKGNRAWGIMAAPRMVTPLILLAVALAVVFQSNWYQLPSTWTCTGVICNSTTSIWLTILWFVICINVATAAFAESSILLTNRRPLYNLKLRQRIERDEGIVDGWTAEKCRRNTVLCAIGVFLLSLKAALGAATVYGIFTFCQGLYTDPNVWSAVVWTAMKVLPTRFAPSYDPISMWTREEVKEIQKYPKGLQAQLKDEMFPRNKRLFLQHKWDLQLNDKLARGTGLNDGLLEILRTETNTLAANNGTPFQKHQMQETFAEFVKIVAERPPKEHLLGVKAKSEAVTLCAEKEDGSARVVKFMLLPGIDLFEPEKTMEEAVDVAQKRMENENDKELYRIARAEVVAQNNFMNSAIKFKYYGKIKS